MNDVVIIAFIVSLAPTIASISAAWVAVRGLKHVKTLRDEMARLNALERKVNIIFARQLEDKGMRAEDIQRFFGAD